MQSAETSNIEPISKLEEATENRSHCGAAFNSLHLAIGGPVKPCCLFEGEIGNLTDSTLDEIWNGTPLRELRSKMCRGERDQNCRQCYEIEDAGGQSMRQSINGNSSTDNVHTKEIALPTYLDIRLSNRCNLKCRTCGVDYSSRWFGDAQKLGWKTPSKALVETFGPGKSAIETLEPLFDTIEEINFAGGEPLLQEEQYVLIEELIRRNRRDVRLAYISNMTELRFGRKDILSLWSQFKDVSLLVSVDGHRELGELIRDGMSWARFAENVAKVRKICPHVKMRFNITVSVFNVHCLPDLCKCLSDIDGAADVPCHFNLVVDPSEYSVQILPADMKADVRRSLGAFALTYEDTPRQSKQEMADEIRSVVNFMDGHDRSNEIKQFREKALKLDKLRVEDTAATIPALAPLLHESPVEAGLRKAHEKRRALYRWTAKMINVKV